MDALQLLVKGTVVVFVLSAMLLVGLAVPSTEIIAPLRRPARNLSGGMLSRFHSQLLLN